MFKKCGSQTLAHLFLTQTSIDAKDVIQFSSLAAVHVFRNAARTQSRPQSLADLRHTLRGGAAYCFTNGFC